MFKPLQHNLNDRTATILEYALIVITASLPLFFNYPYRINLFLAWEGAYRISEGEIPYRDFGSPVGYVFWLLPALFFKIFGPYVHTLLVVQVFINIISGIAFSRLLTIFSMTSVMRLLPLLVYCLSYSMFNFWPWYNHLVFVFELVGLCLLCSEILKPAPDRSTVKLVVAAFFIALTFLTKQDTGGLAACFALFIILFDCLYEKKFKTALIFISGYAVSLAILILPFLQYDFGYWFNMGQFPHNSRVDKFDIVNEMLGASEFIKFYFVVVAFMFVAKLNQRDWRKEKNYFLFLLVVVAILGQASIIQITSYTPIDGNIYFHSFAFAFIIYYFSRDIDYSKIVNLGLFGFLICLWWSGVFWSRFLRERVQKILVENSSEDKNAISRRNYIINKDTLAPKGADSRSKWIVSNIASFNKIRIPQETEEGIKRIMALPESKIKGFKMLNMSELTPLAYDLGYVLETGPQYPLWFHKGVAFFDREVDVFCDKISKKKYDVILFEDIPNLNQFYPYEVRDCIKHNYTFKFKFIAPRTPEISYIEVYTKN